MKKIALIIALLGIFVLFILLNFQAPVQVQDYEDMQGLPDNTKIQVQGKVTSERAYRTIRIIKLDNDIEILCNRCPPYINRTLTVIGTIEIYQNRTQIQALKLSPHKL